MTLERLNGEEKEPTPVSESGRADSLEAKLIDSARELTDDQKRFLLAQIKILREQQ